MALIPRTTIILILCFKVFPPWADTWSDALWVTKLYSFGRDWKEFDLKTYGTFLASTEGCAEVQWSNGTDWINSTVSFQDYWKVLVSNQSGVSEDAYEEIFKTLHHIAVQNKTTARCKKDYTKWVFTAIIPIAVCVAFTLFVWWREEEGWTKLILLPLVLIGLYSQYRAIKIILIGLGRWPNRKQEEWQEEKKKFIRETASIEPSTEALPSLIIQVALLATDLTALFYGNLPSPLVENQALFLATFILTVLLTVMGLTQFLKDGPSPIISSEGYLNGFLSTKFATLFSSVLLWFAVKSLVLMGIIDISAFSSWYEASNVLGFKPSTSPWAGVFYWFSTLVFPQFIHSTIVLIISTRSKVFSLFINFPSFFITPLFTPFTYEASISDGSYEFQISIKHTIVNIVLTVLLTPLTMILYYRTLIWKYAYYFGLTPDQHVAIQSIIDWMNSHHHTYEVDAIKDDLYNYTEYSQFLAIVLVFLPYILFPLAIVPAVYLLRSYRSSIYGSNVDLFRKRVAFQQNGNMKWKLKSINPGEEINNIAQVIDES